MKCCGILKGESCSAVRQCSYGENQQWGPILGCLSRLESSLILAPIRNPKSESLFFLCCTRKLHMHQTSVCLQRDMWEGWAEEHWGEFDFSPTRFKREIQAPTEIR